jgi:hypothetical protein
VENVSAWEIERVKAKLAGKLHGAYFFWRWHKATSKTGYVSLGKQIFCRELFLLTGGSLWATMRALRGHFGLGGKGNRFVEVEGLLKERLPMHGNCEERFLLSRKKYSRGVA